MGDHERWLLGMCYVFAVAIIWIAASFIVQDVQEVGVAPLLLTFICNSLFILYLPVLALVRTYAIWRASGRLKLPWESANLSSSDLTGTEARGGADKPRTSETENLLSSTGEEAPGADVAAPPSSTENRAMGSLFGLPNLRQIIQASLWVSPFWFAAQLTFNLSLNLTSVTSNTILSSTSSLFVFLVSVITLGERFTWLKLVSIVLTMVGSTVVSFSDSSKAGDSPGSQNNTFLGDALVLLSAMAYAIYTVIIRVKLPDEENETMMAFLGFLGAFNAAIFAMPLLIMHYLGLQRINALSLDNFLLIISKGLFDNVFGDYLWARAVLLMTPTAATVGLSIQIPLACAADYFFLDRVPGPLMLLGGLMVVIGFFGINASGWGCGFGSQDAVDTDIQSAEPVGTPLANLKDEAIAGRERGRHPTAEDDNQELVG